MHQADELSAYYLALLKFTDERSNLHEGLALLQEVHRTILEYDVTRSVRTTVLADLCIWYQS